MKTARTLTLWTLGLTTLFSTAGCKVEGKAESGVEYKGTNVTMQRDWAAGQGVTIDGTNGQITVKDGAPAGQLVVTFKPFDILGEDDEQKAIDEMNNNLERDVTADGTNYLVKTGNNGGSTGLGAHIEVLLPPNFNGPLSVLQNNGRTWLQTSGNASSVDVKSDNGSCEVQGSSSAVVTNVVCDNGEVNVAVGVPNPATGGKIYAGNGDVNVDFPSGGKYVIQAQAGGGVFVSENAACSTAGDAETAKTVACGGGVQGDALYGITTGNSFSEIHIGYY